MAENSGLYAVVTQNIGALEILLKAGTIPKDGSSLAAVQTGHLALGDRF